MAIVKTIPICHMCSSTIQKSTCLTTFNRLVGFLFCFVWVWFVCIVYFVFVGFGSFVCLFVCNFSPAFFLVAEINVTSFQDKLFGIANQRSLFCCGSQVFSWVYATIGSETVALHSWRVLWRSHGE